MNSAPSDPRFSALVSWAHHQLDLHGWKIRPASEDASFRRYFRMSRDENSFILMDAPPQQEAIQPFISVTKTLLAAGVHAPAIHAINQDEGFLLLDDLGTTSYLDALSEQTAASLYQDAMNCLLNIQQADSTTLPDYDKMLLQNEMRLFDEWFLGHHLGITLTATQQESLELLQATLIGNALDQPRVFVHRDYHSRNLMVTHRHNPGVIDYQDAVNGPITYDLVSLLRDCYIAWPEHQVRDWALAYRDQLLASSLLKATDDNQFMRWFDLMGLQRHLKAIGIFSRLNHRDGKPGYLQDIPRTLGYILQVADNYPDTRPLVELLAALNIDQSSAPQAQPASLSKEQGYAVDR